MNLVVRTQDAEEALQLTWMFTYRKVNPDYPLSVLTRKYLFAQALAAASEVMRKGRREKTYGEFNDGDEDGGDGAGGLILAFLAIAELSETEFLRRFEELFELAEPPLSDEEKTIIRGYVIECEDQTFGKLGAELGLSLGTVFRNYHRAIRKLFIGLMNQARDILTSEEIEICERHKGEPPQSLSKIAEERQQPLEVVKDIYDRAAAKIWEWAFRPPPPLE